MEHLEEPRPFVIMRLLKCLHMFIVLGGHPNHLHGFSLMSTSDGHSAQALLKSAFRSNVLLMSETQEAIFRVHLASCTFNKWNT